MDIYKVKPAPKHHVWSKSPFDSSTATGGTHTGELDFDKQRWYKKNWSKQTEYIGEKIKLSFWQKLFGSSPAPRTPVPDELSTKVFGTAGNLSSAIWKFGYFQVAAGEIGEKRTEELLQSLLTVPGTRIFHGVKFPGSKTADIDHVVINGNKIVLVDSKNWRNGDYWWSDAETVVRYSNGKTQEFKMSITHALEEYKKMFPDCDVRARVLVHSSNSKRQLFRNTYPTGRLFKKNATVPLVTAYEFFTETGSWLAEGVDGHVDKDILTRLVAEVKPVKKKPEPESTD